MQRLPLAATVDRVSGASTPLGSAALAPDAPADCASLADPEYAAEAREVAWGLFVLAEWLDREAIPDPGLEQCGRRLRRLATELEFAPVDPAKVRREIRACLERARATTEAVHVAGRPSS